MSFLSLAVRLARRDLRGALGSFWILVLGIGMGVAAIAAVGSLAGAALDGLRDGARLTVGGDVSLRLFHQPANPTQRSALAAAGRYSETAELRPLARRSDGGRPTLVELKGVDSAYPLFGTVALAPAQPLAAALERRGGAWGAAVDAALLERMELGLGDALRLGGLDVVIRAEIVAEPDRALRAFSLGPRVMIARAALEASGLAPRGAQVYWYSRLDLPEGADAAAWIGEVEERFPHAGWRIVNADDGVPGLERVVTLGRTMLLLVGLAVLLIGGVGVGGAVSGHLARKTATIATLKSLGAPARLIFTVYLVEVAAAALVGVGAGLALGGLAPLALRPLAADWLPLHAGPQPAALAAAAAFGLLTALLFALWPLGRTQGVGPQQLFRDVVAPSRTRPAPRILAAMALTAAALLALLLGLAERPLPAAMFAVGAGGAALLFLGLGKALAWAAGRARGGRGPLLRLALGNLSRPGAITGPVVMALGLTLTVLVTVVTIEAQATRHLAGAVPETAPAVVFINLPPEAGAAFAAALTGLPGIERHQRMPFLHARVTHIAGEPVHRRHVPADLAWVVRGDRGLSWAATPPPGSRIVAGNWWEEAYAGPPLASLDAEAARRLGIGVGDRLTLNVLGEPLEAEVANLRRIDWSRLGLDFPILLSPSAAPSGYSEVAAVWAAPESVSLVEAAVRQRFPEAPPIRLAPVLAALSQVVEAAAGALAATSLATVAAGLLVLAGSVAGGYGRRVREMVVLKAVGVRPRQLALASVLEFVVLGLATALLASLLGTLAAWAVTSRLAPESWVFLPAVPAALAAATVAAMTATGWLIARRALARSPGALLRERQL